MGDREISSSQLYAALARLRLRGRACDAAIDVIEGVCDTYAEAAQRHGISRAAVSQAAKRIQAEVERAFVTVEVRLPKDMVVALDDWLTSRGGERLTVLAGKSDSEDDEP
jgi:hypothetical protein